MSERGEKMKKVYNFIEIELHKCEDLILTSGEYLETDRTPIGINSFNEDSYNLVSFQYMPTTSVNNYES